MAKYMKGWGSDVVGHVDVHDDVACNVAVFRWEAADPHFTIALSSA